LDTQELRYVDKHHLDFITAYLKHALYYPQFGSLKDLHDIGTVLDVNGELGIVVGYCGVGYEYVLFQNDKKENKYSVRGIETDQAVKLKKVDPLHVLPLFLMMNDYLIGNQFNLCTREQKLCYQHWQRTGKYEFNNPIGDHELERLRLEKEFKEKSKELENIKSRMKELS
jgi:hypothetical protein